jgi:hypothetical protein
MNLTSSLVDEIIDTTGLRNIESSHFAGRHNDFFVYVEVQTHLSRAMMRLRVAGLDGNTRTALEQKIASGFSRQNYSILYEGNEVLVIIPANTDWVKRIRELMDVITFFRRTGSMPIRKPRRSRSSRFRNRYLTLKWRLLNQASAWVFWAPSSALFPV